MKRGAAVCCMLLAGCDTVLGLRHVGVAGDAAPSDKRFVQAASNFVGEPNTMLHVPLDNPPAPHDLLVVAVTTFRNIDVKITDSAGNEYHTTPIQPERTSLNSSVWILYASDLATANPFALDIASTATDASSSEVSAIAVEYGGTFASDPYDVASSDMGMGSGSTISQTCGSIVPTGSDEIYVAALTHDFTGTTTPVGMFSLPKPPLEDATCCGALAVADRIGPGEQTSASFVTAWPPGGTGTPSWACGLVGFR